MNDLPIGPLVDATPAQRPGPVVLEGRHGRLEKLAPRHAAAVWSAFGFEVVEEVRRRLLPSERQSRAEPRTHAGAR